MSDTTLAPELLRKTDGYWRAANYLSVGQIYLYDNPPLKLCPIQIACALGSGVFLCPRRPATGFGSLAGQGSQCESGAASSGA
jgi:hypothetical protein